eukprot:symbB.v1.2.031221.t2/scaffold3600.1/size53445/1
MVFFDFDELEVQAPQAAQAPQAPDTKSVKLRAEPQAARGQAAQAALALQVSRAQETSTLKDPSEKTYQILQKVPSNSEDIVELTLKMLLSESNDNLKFAFQSVYESKDQSLKISSQATVQELQHQLTPSFGSLRLTGAQVGARERFRRREKGWALEGHQALRPEDQLQTLRFNAVLLCQPRLGPVAEIDLQPLRKEVQRAQPGPARAVTTASPGDKVVTSVKSAKSKELERSFPSKPLAQKVQHRWSKTQEDQGAKPPEDLFAQALEMELEIDRRLCLHKHVPKHLEIQHGVFAWSATRIFLVDALNEVLAQMKQAVQGSFLYTKELLCGFALTSLCEALQKLMLEQNEVRHIDIHRIHRHHPQILKRDSPYGRFIGAWHGLEACEMNFDVQLHWHVHKGVSKKRKPCQILVQCCANWKASTTATTKQEQFLHCRRNCATHKIHVLDWSSWA